MAKYKALKSGQTDINSSDIWRFAIHSDYPNVKIKFQGKNNFTMNAGQWEAYYTVQHNLGYIPQVFGWLERSGRIYPCNLFTGISDVLVGGIPASVFAFCSADNTNVYIGAYNKFPIDGPADSNYTFTAHWRISVDEF